MTVQELNRFFLLVTAPFLGMLIWLLSATFSVQIHDIVMTPKSAIQLQDEVQRSEQSLVKAQAVATIVKNSVEKFMQLYEKSNADMSEILKTAKAQAARPDQIFDSRISKQFGKPIRSVNSDNIQINLYTYSTSNYKGYALKVNLKSDQAMKMVLGQDKVGGSETTLQAANRYKAVAGINAGGFADGSGKRYPLSTTVFNSKYVYGFEPTFDNLTFIGMSTDRKLIGGKFSRQADLDKLKPAFGATFVPILLQKGIKQQIPSQWLNSPHRAPRTVVGNFKNDQLLFLVTDGYDEKGGSGATLTELQDLLASLNVYDAYNLDGGGSSSLVFEGKVINSPSDGRLRPLPTHFLFFK